VISSGGGVSDSRSNSGTGVEQRQTKITPQHFCGTIQGRRMKALYSWERGYLEGPTRCRGYGAECFKTGGKTLRREWTREPNERVWLKVTPRKLGGLLVGVNWG